jgi:diacylglycerol kinase
VSQRWRRKFADAGRGVRLAIRTESSLRVQLAAAAGVVAAAALLRCPPAEWAALLGCCGLVLTAELLNTAIEQLFRGLPPADRDRVYPCLDVAAGAVLTASGVAVLVGLLVLGPRAAALLAR